VLELGFLPKAIDRLDLEKTRELRRLVEAMLEKSSRGEAFVHEDREFHRILLSCAGNVLLEQLLKAFWDLYEQSNIVRNHPNLQTVARTHQEILEAVVKKNVEKAIELMKQQFMDVRYHISMLLTSEAGHDPSGG